MENEKTSRVRERRNDDNFEQDTDTHPVATGAGAVGGGLAGAAIGTAVGGPVGTAVGAVIGAVAGGAGGYALGAGVDTAAEDSYWRTNHYNQPFAKSGGYDDYQAGYRTGYTGFAKYGGDKRTFNEAEPELRRSYAESKCDLPWDKARDASRVAWERVARGEAVTIPLSKEEVKVGKREVSQGNATVRKEVHSERVNVPVDLRREELVVERNDRTGGQVPPDAFRETEVRVPLTKEEAVVEKEARVVGEVRVGKKEQREREDVSSTVRREEVKVDTTKGR